MSRKTIYTVLNIKDKMSAGLIKSAQNVRKLTKEERSATREIKAFGKAAGSAVKSITKWGAATAGAATTAFLAMDNLTREYRTAQGKLNTAYEAAGYSAKAATTAYNEFYKILGDTDTATEASQLLAKLALQEQDVTKWTRIAAGVNGTFGDSLPIEGFIEATNETAKTAHVTGVLADALNWVGISEDAMNLKLEQLSSEEARNTLLMETLSGAYDKAADSFYKNNAEMVRTRQIQAQMSATLAKLGSMSAGVRSIAAKLFGVEEDGSVRAGSALEWFNQKLTAAQEKFTQLQKSGVIDSLSQKLDSYVIPALNAGSVALGWMLQHGDVLIRMVIMAGTAMGTLKILKVAGDIISLTHATKGFVSVLSLAATANPFMAWATVAAIAAGVIIANWDKIGPVVKGVVESFVWFGGRTVTVIKGAINSVKSAVSSVFNWFADKWSWFMGLLDTFDDKVSSIPIIGQIYRSTGVGKLMGAVTGNIGHNASGTSYWRGGLTSINERGGEIVDLPSGTRIIPHDVSQSMTRGGVQVYVTVQGNVIGNAQYANSLGEIIARRIMGAMDNV